MPSNRLQRLREWLAAALAAAGLAASRAGGWASGTALVAVLATGEWLGAPQEVRGLLPARLVQGLHVLAGVVVLGALAVLLAGAVRARWRRGGGSRSGAGRRGALAALYGACWAVLLAMGLTGLERFAWLHLDVGLLPFPTMIWWPLHGVLRPYLYALLLIILIHGGKIWVRKTLAYLRTP